MRRTPALLLTVPPRTVRVGSSYSMKRTFSAADVATFAALCGDQNPIHLDPAAAKKAGFVGCIVHGQLVVSLFSYLMGMHMPGPQSIYVSQSVQFVAPILVGEEVEASVTVEKFRKDKGLIMLETKVLRTRDNVIAIKGHSLGKNTAVICEGESPEWRYRTE